MNPVSSPAITAPVLDGAVRLSHWGLMDAAGEDVEAFLHGQLTQDVSRLQPGQLRLAGYCSPKGRLLASFLMWRPQAGRVLLMGSADTMAPSVRRLSMFVLRAKARLTDASAGWRLSGLVGPSAEGWAKEWLGDGAVMAPWAQVQRHGVHLLRLPDVEGCCRYILAAQNDADAQADPLAALPALDLAAWQWLEVCSGVALISAPVAEQFVPQMVNHELVGGVDFRKGCFPGQEVVARSQYRGTLKRRGFLLHGGAPMVAGQEVYQVDDPGQPCGQIVMAAPVPAARGAGWDAFAELKIAAARQGGLRLGDAQGPALDTRALPYGVPLESNELPPDVEPGATAA